MDIKTALLMLIIALLAIVIYQNEDNEDQILGWVQENRTIIQSMEAHLVKTDPTYVKVDR